MIMKEVMRFQKGEVRRFCDEHLISWSITIDKRFVTFYLKELKKTYKIPFEDAINYPKDTILKLKREFLLDVSKKEETPYFSFMIDGIFDS